MVIPGRILFLIRHFPCLVRWRVLEEMLPISFFSLSFSFSFFSFSFFFFFVSGSHLFLVIILYIRGIECRVGNGWEQQSAPQSRGRESVPLERMEPIHADDRPPPNATLHVCMYSFWRRRGGCDQSFLLPAVFFYGAKVPCPMTRRRRFLSAVQSVNAKTHCQAAPMQP
jgi:hypothetical protein